VRAKHALTYVKETLVILKNGFSHLPRTGKWLKLGPFVCKIGNEQCGTVL